MPRLVRGILFLMNYTGLIFEPAWGMLSAFPQFIALTQS